MTIQEVKPPSELRMDWMPSYQRDFDMIVNHPKRFMPTLWLDSASLSKVVGPKTPITNPPTPPIYGLVQGLQNADRIELANGAYGYDKVWNNARTYNFNDSEENQAAALFYGNRHPSLVVAQLMEDSNIHSGPTDPAGQVQRMLKTERILKRVSDLIAADGTPVKDNWIIQDYFSGNYGWDTWAQIDNIGEALSLLGVSSQLEAQKVLYSNDNATRNQSYYYTGQGGQPAGYTYRHRMAPGYPEGFATQGRGRAPYEKIAGLERQYVAMNDRKVAMYGHGTFEGLVYEVVEKGGAWVRLPYRSPAGDIIRLTGLEGSYNMIRTQVMIALNIADAYPIWDVGGRVGTDDTRFDYGYYGGPATWKTRWDNGTGNIIQFTSGAPGQPSVAAPGSGSVFPGNPEISNNAGWDAHYTYAQIWDRCTGSLRYPTFTYNYNGGSTQNGYYNGSVPVSGTLGTEVSRLGVSNIGQNNIIRSYFNGQLPIALEGLTQGNANRRVYQVLNIKAGLTGVTMYNFPNGVNIEHVGDSWGVYKVDL